MLLNIRNMTQKNDKKKKEKRTDSNHRHNDTGWFTHIKMYQCKLHSNVQIRSIKAIPERIGMKWNVQCSK